MLTLVVLLAAGVTTGAQQAKPAPAAATKSSQPSATSPSPQPPTPAQAATPPEGVSTPADYVIGAEDVLSVVVWREKDLTADVMVRPDGMVSLPLLNDVQASGLTPEQFRLQLTQAVSKFVESPNVAVIVKAINSRKVFITGEVAKPGHYPLGGATSVLQLIAQAGGLLEYADQKNIRVMRTVSGKASMFLFNYHDVARGRSVEQNILLKPGDTVIVP
jgi:polysaccharide export outer membrane protein